VKVTEYKIQLFQAWKGMESVLGPGKWWKINQMVANWCTRFLPLHRLSLSTVRLGVAWVNYIVIKYSQITFTWNFWLKLLITTGLSSAISTGNPNHNKQMVVESHGKPLSVFCMHPVVTG